MKNTNFIVGGSLVAIMVVASSVSAKDLVKDNFNDGDYKKKPVWEDDGTAWEVIELNGKKVLKAPAGGHKIRTKFKHWKSSWKLTLKFAEAVGGKDASMYTVKIGSEKNGENIKLNLSDTGRAWLFIPGAQTFIEQIKYGEPGNSWHDLLIAYQASSQTLSMKMKRDGKEIYAKKIKLKQGIKEIDFLELETSNFAYEKGCFDEIKLTTGK